MVNWLNNGSEIRNIKDENGKQRSRTQNEKFYFKEGVTYSASGSKGASFRIHPKNSLFDVGGSCIFPTNEFNNLKYLIALLNSKLAFYILECLNPTVNTQVGDMQRIPFVKPEGRIEQEISELSENNINLKKYLNSYRIIETNFEKNPLMALTEPNLRDQLLSYLNYENAQLTSAILNEAKINQLIFKVYNLKPEDRHQVETKMGKPVGEMPILSMARDAYMLTNISINKTL